MEIKIMILKELKIDTWIGDKTNCYVIFDEESKEIMVIDPAGDVDKIEDLIKNVFKGNLKYIHCENENIVTVDLKLLILLDNRKLPD